MSITKIHALGQSIVGWVSPMICNFDTTAAPRVRASKHILCFALGYHEQHQQGERHFHCASMQWLAVANLLTLASAAQATGDLSAHVARLTYYIAIWREAAKCSETSNEMFAVHARYATR
jgi:hypothetical protein